ncbi:glycerophosphoryl diester phosphodiesterase [Ruminococcus sp. YRD2003]|uniref:glycerophosphodiester phosphodiesterase family protein n=1 Tax=Ruminococcus sp. YRD2003 TaxID=1452313 RepID=UPI0008CF93D2|nr:glycerophosphoryl diester phosphodiesterase [Ruminococcus flavefaciens]
MKKNFFKSIGVFIRALPDVLLYELIFKLLLLSVGAPLLTLLLKLTMKISRVRYLSDEKVWIYLKNPATLIALLLILFFSAVFSFVELSGLTACYSCYYKGERLSVIGMFRTGYHAFKKAFRGKGLLCFLTFMVYMPIAQYTISSGIFLAPILPILRDAFRAINTRGALAVYIGLQILFAILIVSRSYSLHFLVLTDKPFYDCIQESRKLIIGQKMKYVLSFVFWTLFIIAAIAVITFTVSFAVLLFIKGISSSDKALISSLKVLRYEGEIFAAIAAFISTPIVMCWLTSRFFLDVPEDTKITLPERTTYKLGRAARVILYVSIISASLLLNYSYISALHKGNINLNVGIITRTQVTAHRGCSKDAPENTLYAFEKALESNTDYIELDVQLTKDEQLVVFHDEKLDRATHGKGKLSDYTYDELQELNVISKYVSEEDFPDARIPLLTEVFELVGDEKLFNIEIKDHGDTNLTVEKTVEAIKEYDIEGSCYVTSFSYSALKKVKQLDPDIKTGLIANVATTTAFMQMKNIDALSMNHLLVNATVVNNAHQNGKRIFVWTVNSQSEMEKMMALGVDNIITDCPDRASKVVYSTTTGEKVLNVLKAVFGSYY